MNLKMLQNMSPEMLEALIQQMIGKEQFQQMESRLVDLGIAIYENDAAVAESIAADLDLRRIPMLAKFLDSCLYHG